MLVAVPFLLPLSIESINASAVVGSDCSLYLDHSSIPGAGFGVFTAVDLEAGDVVDTGTPVPIRVGSVFGTQLHNFAFAADYGPSTLCLGSAMMHNHGDDPNVELRWNYSNPNDASTDPTQAAQTVAFTVAKRGIPARSELLISYGSNSWFQSRHITRTLDMELRGNNPVEPSEDHFCLSNVYTSESTIPLAGRGLFTKANVLTGQIITISPVLFLPKKRYLRSDLAKYLVSESDEELAVLPIGSGAIINHGGVGSNAVFCWYNIKSKKACVDRPDFLHGGEKTKNDLIKSSTADYYIAYVASRAITADDEITLNYGKSFNSNGLNEHLLRGGTEFEASASPIEVIGLFGDDFKNAAYKDTFREDALRALAGIDAAEISAAFNKKAKREL